MSGRVYFTSGHHHGARLSATRLLPAGAIFDTRHGTVRIISATDANGDLQSAEFRGGQFQASQPAGDDAALQVKLVGGNFAACRAASPTAARPRPPVRRLSTIDGYHSGVRTVGRYGSGSTRGRGARPRSVVIAANGVVSWDTVDRCDGTAVVDHFGDVNTAGRAVPVHFGLTPHETIAYRCGAKLPVSRAYCAVVRGTTTRIRLADGRERLTPTDELTLVTHSSSAQYTLDVSSPDGFLAANSYTLSRPDGRGFRRSDVSCLPYSGVGTYQATWRLGDALLASIQYQVPRASTVIYPCHSSPFSRGTPADLNHTVLSSGGHFLVHYTTDPEDRADVSSRTAALAAAATAERALRYDTTTLGMPSYLNDGDGKLDIYIENPVGDIENVITPPAGRSALPPYGDPTASYLVVPPSQTNNAFGIGFGVFAALRNAIGYTRGLEAASFIFSTNDWAAGNFSQEPGLVPPLSDPLDPRCVGTCPGDAYYGQWRFYQHLAEQFGDGIVAALIRQDAQDIRRRPVPQMDAALQQVLAAKGTTLSAEIAQYALEDVSDGWRQAWVGENGLDLPTDEVPITADPTGGAPAESPPISVSDLAARVLNVSVPPLAPCVADTLTVDATAPPGGTVPGASLMNGTQFQTIPAAASSGAAQQVTVPFNSCAGATVRVPLVNTTTADQPMSFTATAAVTRGS